MKVALVICALESSYSLRPCNVDVKSVEEVQQGEHWLPCPDALGHPSGGGQSTMKDCDGLFLSQAQKILSPFS